MSLHETSKRLSSHDGLTMEKVNVMKKIAVVLMKKTLKEKKKCSHHCASEKGMVGSLVCRRIGRFLPKKDTQRRRLRDWVQGYVTEELGRGKWTVHFKNDVALELTSNQVTFIHNHHLNEKKYFVESRL